MHGRLKLSRYFKIQLLFKHSKPASIVEYINCINCKLYTALCYVHEISLSCRSRYYEQVDKFYFIIKCIMFNFFCLKLLECFWFTELWFIGPWFNKAK